MVTKNRFRGMHWSQMPNVEEIKLKISTNRKGKCLGNTYGFKKGQKAKNWNGFHKNHKPWNKDLKGFLAEEKHYLWKGNKVGYTALHDWVRKYKGNPKSCEDCGTINAKRFEWANFSGHYKRDLNDWVRLCKSCHEHFDRTRCII